MPKGGVLASRVILEAEGNFEGTHMTWGLNFAFGQFHERSEHGPEHLRAFSP